MNGIGARLREERERLGLTQRNFGQVGGVEPNAQGKYENGDRTPKADYLAAVATLGVDALYVVTGERTPTPVQTLSESELGIVQNFRKLQEDDQDALRRLVLSLGNVSIVPTTKGRKIAENK